MDILNYFLTNYALKYSFEKGKVLFGDTKKGCITIKKEDNGFFDGKKQISTDGIVWKSWKNKEIPFLFSKDANKEILTKTDGYVSINYDVVSASSYLLSGWHEHISDNKDSLGRVNYQNSLMEQLGITEIPVVNYYFDILHTALNQLNDSYSVEKSKFSVALTHDIDNCMTAWVEGSFSELKNKKIHNLPRLLFKRLFKKDEWFNFEEISALETTRNARSTFFFLPQKGKVNGRKNADYDVTSKTFQHQIELLIAKGHEIGLHGSFGTHVDFEKFILDKERLGTSVHGNRFHFLMFDVNQTTSLLEKAGIKYDASIGFAEHVGFRRGSCYPFFMYDFENNRISNVLELSTHIMDTTLQHNKYMSIPAEKASDTVKPIIDEVIKFNGVLSLLWHNTHFSRFKYGGWKEVYVKILNYCKKHHAKLTTCEDIYQSVVK